MKKVLIIAVALASANAFATRARVTALGNSEHLLDTQTVYSNPADMVVLADYVNFESGSTAAGAENSNAEGMITRSMGDSKFGLSLGHLSQSASIWGLRNPGATVTNITGIISQQNPVGLSYGTKFNDMIFGGTLIYSNYDDKKNSVKESSAGLRLGLRTGAWDVKAAIGLGNNFENATEKFTGTGGISAGAGYAMDDLYFHLYADQSGFKTETSGVEARKFDASSYKVGVIKSAKKEGNELFYGAALAISNRKLTITGTDAAKISTLSLPVTLGMEVDAATWLTVRGSVTQNVILSNSKDDVTGGAETAPGLNTTTAAVGTGLKFGKLTVDATLQGLTGSTQTQKINGTDLFALVGATYMY